MSDDEHKDVLDFWQNKTPPPEDDEGANDGTISLSSDSGTLPFRVVWYGTIDNYVAIPLNAVPDEDPAQAQPLYMRMNKLAIDAYRAFVKERIGPVAIFGVDPEVSGPSFAWRFNIVPPADDPLQYNAVRTVASDLFDITINLEIAWVPEVGRFVATPVHVTSTDPLQYEYLELNMTGVECAKYKEFIFAEIGSVLVAGVHIAPLEPPKKVVPEAVFMTKLIDAPVRR